MFSADDNDVPKEMMPGKSRVFLRIMRRSARWVAMSTVTNFCRLALVIAGINSERSLSPKVMCVKDSVCVPSNLDKRL